MKWRNSIIYLIVLLLLGGYYYYFEVVRKEQKQAAERESKRVFHFAAADVEALQIESKDKKRVRLNKNGGWKITEPISCDVDQASLEGLLNTLAALQRERSITDKSKELKSFGLASPALRMRIQQRDQSLELLLGDKNPTGEAYYAMVIGQDDVFTVSEGIWGVLNKGLDELRRRELFTFEPREINSMRVKWENEPEVFVQRNEQGKWSSPDHPKVDIKDIKVGNVLDQLRWLRAQKFIENQAATSTENRLDTPQVTVNLQLQKDRSAQLTLGKKTDDGKEVPAVSSEISGIVLVSADILRELPKSIRSLQDRSIISLKTGDITAVKWKLDDQEGHVARLEENKWGWAATDEGQPKELNESWQVSSLLYDLVEAEYVEEVNPPASVPSWPYGRVDFYGGDNKLASIIWNKPLKEDSKSASIWVEQGEESAVRLVDVEAELMQRTQEDLKKLSLSNAP
ncbi:MAG: DUF4340 domain-containing protein [Desulforhabdus sp.]|jgi:hypothetical protein|nr:DUF4340 domain-containing protein [Desulforhabdus sp.]